MRTVALIPAAGSGVRLGAGVPKAFVELCGSTMLQRAVDGVQAAGVVEIVVAVPADREAAAVSLLPDVRVVVGGGERSDSVRSCLAALAVCDDDVVLIHDAARALTPPDVFARVIAAVAAGADAVVPAIPVTDTLKSVDSDDLVTATVDREPLRAVQTPQGFRAAALLAAHASGGDATDDAGLVESAGMPVHVVPGDRMAFKITTDFDLRMARMLLEARA